MTSVPLDLWGGLHDHLGLVLPASKYNNISGTAYSIPKQIPKGTQMSNAIQLHEKHNQKFKFCRERASIENTLNSQIMTAVDSLYITELKNSSTEIILLNIP